MTTCRHKTVACRGAALLIVLLLVMAVTILSLGYLWYSDVQLVCGQNMTLRTSIDALTESAFEHAKGLLLEPQDIPGEYWTGANGLQLSGGSDYYDVNIVRDGSDPNDRCTYIVDCNAYRITEGVEIGRSGLQGEIRLDPCICLWTTNNASLWSNTVIYGDVYCAGTLTNAGSIDGDVFALSLTGSVTGGSHAAATLDLVWPYVTVGDFTSHHTTVPIGSATLSDTTYGPYDPARVCHRSGDLVLEGNVTVDGMLVVDGNLTVRGTNNVILAAKNLPALLVTGDLHVDGSGTLSVEGLAVVDNRVLVSGGGQLGVLGGVFTKKSLYQTAPNSAVDGYSLLLNNGPTWRPGAGQLGGGIEFDGVNDFLEDPNAEDYLEGLGGVTVSLWVKSDTVGQDRGIFFTRDPIALDQELGLRYDAIGDGGATECIKASLRTSKGTTQIESSANLQTTAWQHLAITWATNANLKLYVNGVLNSPSYDGGSLRGTVLGVEKLVVGVGAMGQYWDGHLDDVRIYNRALNANELYPPQDGISGLIGHWRLDGDSPSVTITAAPMKAAIITWSMNGDEHWSPAADAFYRSVRRK